MVHGPQDKGYDRDFFFFWTHKRLNAESEDRAFFFLSSLFIPEQEIEKDLCDSLLPLAGLSFDKLFATGLPSSSSLNHRPCTGPSLSFREVKDPPLTLHFSRREKVKPDEK